MIIFIPLLAAIIGVLMYALAANPKLSEIGRILFWTGALVTLLHVGSETANVLGK